jgi:membrane-associated phospholipid phosphatase
VTLVTVYCVITAAVAAGVVALRWHYFTDTVAGAATGTGTVLTLALVMDLAPAVVTGTRKLPDELTRPPEPLVPGDSR